MNWLGWALASALFAALTAILAKIGVAGCRRHAGHRLAHLRRPGLHLDHGMAEPGRRRVARIDAAELGLPGALRHRHRPFLALLFPGARDGARLARGAHR